VSPTDSPPKHRRSLVNEVLAAQLAVAAVVGLIALIGLAWTSGSVIRNNLEHWAAQWAGELNDLGAPFYLSDGGEAVFEIERFIDKYPEIERVTWYRPDGSSLLAIDESGPVASAPQPRPSRSSRPASACSRRIC